MSQTHTATFHQVKHQNTGRLNAKNRNWVLSSNCLIYFIHATGVPLSSDDPQRSVCIEHDGTWREKFIGNYRGFICQRNGMCAALIILPGMKNLKDEVVLVMNL